ncbi:hypothetical protein [Metabacillus sp. FJAT-52054]|uniref:Uncharacterized protein n=1 Tax=Metabacillus sediminis TaxID=3117746 RepID=A0ABZ2NIL3_9BACI
MEPSNNKICIYSWAMKAANDVLRTNQSHPKKIVASAAEQFAQYDKNRAS